MGKTLLSISRRIAGKTETVELAGQPELAMLEIRRLKDKLGRMYELAPYLPHDKQEKVNAIRKEWMEKQKEFNPLIADLRFKWEDMCRQERQALLQALREEEKIIQSNDE